LSARRGLAGWLRRTAHRAPARHPLGRTRELLLYDRVAEVRAELIEIAAILDCLDDPDAAAIAMLRGLLADGCGSPLYNPDIHVSELRATLYHARARLEAAVARRREHCSPFDRWRHPIEH
jgi:hypothetical protein